MLKTIEVEIDADGQIRPLDNTQSLPPGRALLVWSEEADPAAYIISELALADWLRPEEDEAWAYLQPVTSDMKE